MAKRRIIHVTFSQRDRRWRARGGDRTLFFTKAEAVEAAKRLAKAAPLGQVIVHKKSGGIQTEYTYGRDPRRTKG